MNDNHPSPRKAKKGLQHIGDMAERVAFRALLKKGRRNAAAERGRKRLRVIKQGRGG